MDTSQVSMALVLQTTCFVAIDRGYVRSGYRRDRWTHTSFRCHVPQIHVDLKGCEKDFDC